METKYSEVPKGDEINGTVINVPWKFFFRQLLVSSGIWTTFFAIGIVSGTPTVYIAQVRREANSMDAVSVEMASWLTSVFTYSALPCCLIMAFLTGYIGRKKSFIIISLNQVLVATCYYLSTTPKQLLITEIFQGLTNSGSITVCLVAMAEYTSPRNRGPLITVKTATVYWGIWAANTIGAFAPWKYISILGFLNAFYSLTVFFWPESPTWLASQGRYEECSKSHRWLRGCDPDSEKELEALIETHMEYRKICQKKQTSDMFKFFLEQEFYRPIILCTIMSLIYLLSGKQVIALYAVDIMKQVTSAESTAFTAMLIIDGVTVFVMYAGCLMSRILKRRFMLFVFGGAAMFFLLCISLYMYLIHLSYLSPNEYISISLLIAFSISIGLGPMILGTSIHAELIPLRYKSQATVVISCVFVLVQSILLKNTLYIIQYLHLFGMFLSNAVSGSICLCILYKYLPETKDKTLVEIDKYFKS